jgi:hypothetical protein
MYSSNSNTRRHFRLFKPIRTYPQENERNQIYSRVEYSASVAAETEERGCMTDERRSRRMSSAAYITSMHGICIPYQNQIETTSTPNARFLLLDYNVSLPRKDLEAASYLA